MLNQILDKMATEEELVMRNVSGHLHWSCLDCTKVAVQSPYLMFLFKHSATADEAICGFLQQDD